MKCYIVHTMENYVGHHTTYMLWIYVHTDIFYLFAQEVTIDPRLVPKVGMTFSGVDEAYTFYSRYAYEVGFPLKKYRERKNCKCMVELLDRRKECSKGNIKPKGT